MTDAKRVRKKFSGNPPAISLQTKAVGTGFITASIGEEDSEKKATLKIEGKVPVEKYGFNINDELIETEHGYLAKLHTTTASDGIRFTEELPNRIVITCEVPSLFLLDDEPVKKERMKEYTYDLRAFYEKPVGMVATGLALAVGTGLVGRWLDWW